MINAKALRCEQPEISRIALLLSTFYRTTLNKGAQQYHCTGRVAGNITAYIALEKFFIRHSRSTAISMNVYSHTVLLILSIQPLVENAILHGISGKGKHRYRTWKNHHRRNDGA